MADETTPINLEEAPVRTLDDGGHMVVLNGQVPGRLPVAAVKEAVDLAATAVQPESLGGAAFEPADAFIRVADHQAQMAAVMARLQALEDGTDIPTATAPSVTSVSITGSGVAGSVHTATAVYSGAPTPSLSWQWYIVEDEIETAISGATSSTYTPPLGGVVLRARLTATNATGSASGASAVVSVTAAPITYLGGLTDVTLTAGTSFSRVWSNFFSGASAYSVGSGLTGGVSSGTGSVNYNVASVVSETVTMSVTATNATGGTRTVTFKVTIQATGTAASWSGAIPDQVVQVGSSVDVDLAQFAAGTNLVFASTTVLTPFQVTSAGRLQNTSALSSVIAEYSATVSVDNEWGPPAVSNTFKIAVTAVALTALSVDDINVTGAVERYVGWRTPRLFPTPLQPYAPGANPFTFTAGSNLVKVKVDPDHKPIAGQRIYISGATAKDGILLDGSYAVQSLVAGTNEVQVQLASPFSGTSGTGGGSTVLVRNLYAGIRWSRRTPDANGVIDAAYFETAYTITVSAAEGSTPARVEIQLLQTDPAKRGNPSTQTPRTDYSVWSSTETATFRLSVQPIEAGGWTEWSGAVPVPPVTAASAPILPLSPRTKEEYLAGLTGNHGIQYQRQRVRDLSIRDEYKNRGLTFQDEGQIREWRIIDGKLHFGYPRLAGAYFSKGAGLYLNSDDASGDGLFLGLGGQFETEYNTGNKADTNGLYRSDKTLLTATKITVTRGDGSTAFTNVAYAGNTFDRQGNHICRRPQIYDGSGNPTLTDTQRPIYVVEHIGARGNISAIHLFKSTNGAASFAYVRELVLADFSDGDDGIQIIACCPNGDLVVSCAKGIRVSQDGGVNWSTLYSNYTMPLRIFGGSASTASGAYFGAGEGSKSQSQAFAGIWKVGNIRSGTPTRVLQTTKTVNGVANVGWCWDLDVDPDDPDRVAACFLGAVSPPMLTVDGGDSWAEIADTPPQYNGSAADEAWRYEIKNNGDAGYHSGFIFLPNIKVGSVTKKFCVGFTEQTVSFSDDGGATFPGANARFFNGLHAKAHGVSTDGDWRKITYGCQDSTVNVMLDGSHYIQPIGYGTGSDELKDALVGTAASPGPLYNTQVYAYLTAFANLIVPAANNRVIACISRNTAPRRSAIVIFENPDSDGVYRAYTIKNGLATTRGHFARMSPKGGIAFMGRYAVSNFAASAASGVTFQDRTNEFISCFLRGTTLVSYWLNATVGASTANHFGNVIFRGTSDDGTHSSWFTLTSRAAPQCVCPDTSQDERVLYTPINEKNAIYEIVRNGSGTLVTNKIADFASLVGAQLTAEGVSFIPAVASYVSSIEADPNAPGVVYAAVGIQGCPNLWRSVDGGSTWNFIGDGIPRSQYELWAHPQTSDIILDSSIGGHVVRASSLSVAANQGAFYDQQKAYYESIGVAPPAFF